MSFLMQLQEEGQRVKNSLKKTQTVARAISGTRKMIQPDGSAKNNNDDGASDVSSLDTDDDPLAVDWLSNFLVSASSTHPPNSKSSTTTSSFKIVTWNLWFAVHHWRERLEAALAEILLIQDPDIFCLQEVRTEVHQCMLDCVFLRERYQPTEERLTQSYDCATWVKRDSSRIIGVTGTTLTMESIYGRRGCCCDFELTFVGDKQAKLRIVNTHLESGKEMEATRRRQLETLFLSIRKMPFQRQHPVEEVDVALLVGDFNLDPSYPENELVDESALDVWKALRPKDPGYTENTYRNQMRYLVHGKHKQVRYDRIVIVNPSKTAADQHERRLACKPEQIDILGDRPFDKKGTLWVSDHFGLMATMTLEETQFSANKDVSQGQH
mmetsp:Transcript_38667/g.93490  ORF Transcript_38667/g.93490 Transcript_38667/m.93490 type:complete len:382 (-) Transcript_38667:168-1313(-)